MKSAAARQRRYRQRQRDELVVLAIEDEPNTTADLLIVTGLLSPEETRDHRKVREAASRAWAEMKADVLKRFRHA
jgi:hypothetical protein